MLNLKLVCGTLAICIAGFGGEFSSSTDGHGLIRRIRAHRLERIQCRVERRSSRIAHRYGSVHGGHGSHGGHAYEHVSYGSQGNNAYEASSGYGSQGSNGYSEGYGSVSHGSQGSTGVMIESAPVESAPVEKTPTESTNPEVTTSSHISPVILHQAPVCIIQPRRVVYARPLLGRMRCANGVCQFH